jgi:Fic family protein
MDPDLFQPGHPGRLVRSGTGDAAYWAFVPNPLPPTIEWDTRLVSAVSTAERALGELAGLGRNLPNPHLLIGAFKRREAVLSSRIEGTQASVSDLLLFEAAPELSPAPPDVREVANYVRALEHGLVRQATLPMSTRLLREMHEHLMEGVRGQERTPGQFRTSQNWIGPAGSTINSAVYVPPPPADLADALSALERYLHAPSDLPLLVRLALIHYQFEAIHPFLDGNGRIGRLLITLVLCLEGALPGPLLYLSAFFEHNRRAYYDGLLGVSTAGRWTEWIEFFLRGVAEQSADAVSRAATLLDLQGDFHERIRRSRGSALLSRAADELFRTPATTVTQMGRLLEVTPRAAQKNIDKLVELGILKEVTGKRRNRVWVAEQIGRIAGESIGGERNASGG